VPNKIGVAILILSHGTPKKHIDLGDLIEDGHVWA